MNNNNQRSTVVFYNKKIEEVKCKGSYYLAKKYKSIKLKEEIINYDLDFPYMDQENKVLKVWENLEYLLSANSIDAVYHKITKSIEVYGLDSKGLNECILDIHSLCTKYGFKLSIKQIEELDSTLKKDLAKLKTFLTEQEDEYRKPYAAFPIKYPRMTSFYATANQGDFLKYETGNRRYWVIPVDKF